MWGGYYGGLALGVVIGATIASLPDGYSTVYVSGVPYYYSGGVYYGQQGTSYVVIPPPVGAVVTVLPSDCFTVEIDENDEEYYDCGGAFYDQVDDGYAVVSPPVGAVVNVLPDGAQAKKVGGMEYYAFGDAYYKAVYSGSQVVYEVVAPPSS